MPNPTTKQELLDAVNDGYALLNEQIAKMSEADAAASFAFTADPKKCGVRWQNHRCFYTTSMAAYFLSVTPYGQAVKILKTHQKSLKKK